MSSSHKNSAPDFRSLFESLPGLFLALLPDLTIAAASNAYLEATNTTRENMLGRHIFEVFPDNPNDPTATGVSNLRTSLLRVLANKKTDTMAEQKYDIRRPLSEGGGFEERYWSPVNKPVLNKKGEVTYIIHQVEDITELVGLKKKENQLEKTISDNCTQLEKTLVKEKELNEMKSRFVATASHEFRTPLSSLLLSLNLIETYGKSGDYAKQVKHFGRIRSAVKTLIDILNDFLSLEKLGLGYAETHYEYVDLCELVHVLIQEMDGLRKEQQKIVVSYTGEKKVWTDPKMVHTILLNLLSNAIKYSEKDVELDVEIRANEMVFIIRDNGIGIPADEQKNIFTRFFRARNAFDLQGTGLGLSIVKRYIELTGGTIDFSSEENEGTSFVVRIPTSEQG
jgi:signal transduction histidine kinase